MQICVYTVFATLKNVFFWANLTKDFEPTKHLQDLIDNSCAEKPQKVG